MKINMSTHIIAIGAIASAIMAAIALLSFLVKPIRNKIMGMSKHQKVSQYLIKLWFTTIYHNNLEQKQIRQYEFELLAQLYNSYKELRDDPIISKIYNEIVSSWTIV